MASFTMQSLKTTFARFAAAFPASFPDESAAGGVLALWAELLAEQVWVDDAVLRRAATLLLLRETGRYLPGPGRALEYLREAKAALDREERRALPPPAPSAATGPRPSNATLLRHIAIGKLRARTGRLLAGGDPDRHDFSEAQINALLAEMAERDQFAALHRLPETAAPVDVVAALTGGDWPRQEPAE